jgi:hypothetical protein
MRCKIYSQAERLLLSPEGFSHMALVRNVKSQTAASYVMKTSRIFSLKLWDCRHIANNSNPCLPTYVSLQRDLEMRPIKDRLSSDSTYVTRFESNSRFYKLP